MARIWIDGGLAGDVTVATSDTYSFFWVGDPTDEGRHEIEIGLANDYYRVGECDRNLFVAAARMEFPSSATTTSQTSTATPTSSTPTPTTAPQEQQDWPGASNTGVPPGTELSVVSGDLVIKEDGTVIDSVDVHGYVRVQANNVTIKRSIIRGGAQATRSNALVAAWWNYKNIIVEDSTLVAANAGYHIDGLSGSNITGRRLNIYGVVDPIKVIGGPFKLTDSWVHDTLHYEPDPNQSDGKTHDDSVQIEGGTNIVLDGNRFEDAHNAAIMVTQNHSVTANVTISNNYLSHGACAVNVTQSGLGVPIVGMRIVSNRFGPGAYGRTCPMRLPLTSVFSVVGNTWIDTGLEAKPLWF